MSKRTLGGRAVGGRISKKRRRERVRGERGQIPLDEDLASNKVYAVWGFGNGLLGFEAPGTVARAVDAARGRVHEARNPGPDSTSARGPRCRGD